MGSLPRNVQIDLFPYDLLWLTCDVLYDSVHNNMTKTIHTWGMSVEIDTDKDNVGQALHLWLRFIQRSINWHDNWLLTMTSTIRDSIWPWLWERKELLAHNLHDHDNLSLIRIHWWRWAWGDWENMPVKLWNGGSIKDTTCYLRPLSDRPSVESWS